MDIQHNSREIFYRKPFGACRTEDTVTLRIMVLDRIPPRNVNLVVTGENMSACIPMRQGIKMLSNYVFEAVLQVPEATGIIWYYFEIVSMDGTTAYYGNNDDGLGGMGRLYDSMPLKKYQITVYDKAYKTPDWIKGAVMYQIFPDRFYNGNDNGEINRKENAVFHETWDEFPFYKKEQFGGEYLFNDFFGGNLKGIEKKLGYLSELGVEVIYLNPVFKAFSNHRYDTGSYEEVDAVLGTNADFEALCKTAKQHGIRIILDGVFSHTGSDSMYFNKKGRYPSQGAYQSQQSPYYSWYRFHNFPDNYESWWGIDTLPNVEETDEGYRKYILSDSNSIVKQWLRRGAAGFRLDVVDELPDSFLKELRREMKKENPDSLIIGEVWEDASNKESYGELREYLTGDELDSVMNYPFRNAIVDFVIGRADAFAFESRIMSIYENYPQEASYAMMNLLSSHDIMRIRHAMAEAPDLSRDEQAGYYLSEERCCLARLRQKIAAVLQVTLVGAPCIYYGDEAGMSGYCDPFNRQTFPWKYIDNELLDFYKKVISVRNNRKSIKNGKIKSILLDKHMYVFVRYISEGKDVFGRPCENEAVMVVVNCDRENYCKYTVNLSEFNCLKLTDMINHNEVQTESGFYTEEIEPLGYRIYNLNL